MSAAILESKVICKQPGRYLAWPTIAKAPDGVFYAVFSGDRDLHVCPFGKIFLMRSEDEGRTWSEPAVAANTPLDDRDAGLCVCPDGTLVVTWITSHYFDYRPILEKFAGRNESYFSRERWSAWEKTLAALDPETIRRWTPSFETRHADPAKRRRLGFWTARSKDGGKTWDEPTPSPVGTPHGPAVMPNGDLMFLGCNGFMPEDGPCNLGVALSRDQGVSWETLAALPSFPSYPGPLEGGLTRLVEPHLTITRSGKALGLVRSEETGNRQPRLYQTESTDGGHTWSELRRTEILGKPPHLTVLAGGGVLLSYGYRHDPFGQRVRLSLDEGKTWGPETVLRADATNTDLGYASTAECRDGTLVSLYYQVETPGEPPSLMQTRFRLSK